MIHPIRTIRSWINGPSETRARLNAALATLSDHYNAAAEWSPNGDTNDPSKVMEQLTYMLQSREDALRDASNQLRSLAEHHAVTASCAKCLGHHIDDGARQEAYKHAEQIVMTAWHKAIKDAQ